MLNIIIISLYLLTQVLGAPLPRIITRYHTADAVTNTFTTTTGTTTIFLPPVEIFISNGVTYTFTLTQQTAAIPTTFTSYYQDKQVAPATEVSPTTSNEQPTEAAQTTPNQQPTEAAQTTSNQQPTEAAQATSNEQPTEAAQTTSNQQPTEAAQTTSNQQPTEAAQTTSNQQPTEAAQATSNEQPTEAAQTTSNQQPTEAAQTTSSEQTASQTTNTTNDYTSSLIPTSTNSETSTSSTNTDPNETISPPDAIVYSPYTDNGGCKDTSTIQSDLDYIYSLGISKIRLYGTDCGTFSAILPYCEGKGIKVNQGLWFSSDGVDSINDAINDLVSYGQENGWDVFDYITVGNEAISDGYVSADELVSKISSVKSTLNNAGYSGELTTSEPASSFVSNPSLCSDSDITFVGINVHSYFDQYVNASQAGSFLLGQIQTVSKVCGSKKVVVTETGYPSKGDTNGLNIPSEENQKIAIESIIQSTNGQITILTTFNDYWKSPGPYGIEQYFGAAYLFK